MTKLKAQSNATVSISNSTENPNFISFANAEGLQLKASGAKAKAAEFLSDHFKAFNLKSDQDLLFVEENVDITG